MRTQDQSIAAGSVSVVPRHWEYLLIFVLLHNCSCPVMGLEVHLDALESPNVSTMQDVGFRRVEQASEDRCIERLLPLGYQ